MPRWLLSRCVCRRATALAVAAVTVFASLASTHAARHRISRPTLTPFARAEQLRDALESRPESQRTRSDYGIVLDAYRGVYHDDPSDPKASEAVNMVGGLLAEEGRIFHSEKTSLDAVGQFEFLRAQYPASPFRATALLAEASIYLHDLHESAAARAAYLRFLNSYPAHPLAAQARAGLREIDHQPAHNRARPPDVAASSESGHIHAAASRAEAATTTTQSSPIQGVTPGPDNRASQAVVAAPAGRDTSGSESASTSAPATASAPAATLHQNELTRLEPAPPSSASRTPSTGGATGQPLLTGAARASAQAHHGPLPVVTNVRHWSTPVYTRVAIDLQDQVEYEAARVPNPDRIYFDLHGARVAPELIGKTVRVTDDGFLERIRIAQFSNDVTRIVLDVSQVSDYSAFFLPNPWRLIIDIHGRRPGSQTPQQVAAIPPVRVPPANLRPAEPVATSEQTSGQATRTVEEVASVSTRPDRVKATRRPTTGPIAASVSTANATPDLPSHAATPAPPPEKPAHRDNHADDQTDDEDAAPPPRNTSREADSTLDGQRSLTRALGLKIGRIVVDAGHGGHDSGTLGPGGIQEKDVVLDVALRLGKLLHQRLGADVVYTRSDDTFIPLEERTAIANKAQADLFISVHANSSSDPTARGVETYYLNFTTSPDALEVAARENAVSDQSIHQLSGLVKKITLKDKIDESRQFAANVENALYSGLEQGNPGLRDRGVKKAPFVVLIGANMPSILAEISFLTNPDDAAELRQPRYRERIAESLYQGVAKYVNGLSGLRIAENARAFSP